MRSAAKLARAAADHGGLRGERPAVTREFTCALAEGHRLAEPDVEGESQCGEALPAGRHHLMLYPRPEHDDTTTVVRLKL